MIRLYPFQEKSKEALRANLRRGIRRQILCSPTGSGKTEIAMSLVQDAASKGSRVVFICDRQALVTQTSERFTANDILHGVAMSDQTRGRRNNIQVASAQTLEKRGFWFGGTQKQYDLFGNLISDNEPVPDLVVWDECHEIRKAIAAYILEHDLVLLGLSATPLTDGLDEIYEEIVNVTTTNQLIKDAYLAPVHVVNAQAEVDVKGVDVSSNGEWVARQLSERVKVIVGDIVPEWEYHTAHFFGGPVKTIAFGASVADCKDISRQFQEAGYDFRVVYNGQPNNQELIDAYKRGEHLGLVSCMILTKGFDAPDTICMVDAGPLRESLKTHIQKIGRIMRTSPGKEAALLIDHAGNFVRFMDRANLFFQTGVNTLPKKKKRKKGRRSGPKTDPKCHQCGYVFTLIGPEAAAVTLCPSCGADRKRPRDPTTVVMPGELGYVATLDGSLSDFITDTGEPIDLWLEVCANALVVCHGDETRANKMALAQFRSIFGTWSGRDFEDPGRPPLDAVRDLCYRAYKLWKAAQDKRKEADA